MRRMFQYFGSSSTAAAQPKVASSNLGTNDQEAIFRLDQFHKIGQTTSGKSASFRGRLSVWGGQDWQVKTSNRLAGPFSIFRFRSWVGYDPDSSDMVGEFIASSVAARILNSENGPELSPEVRLVIESRNRKRIGVASKYLNSADGGGAPSIKSLSVTEVLQNNSSRSIPDRDAYKSFRIDCIETSTNEPKVLRLNSKIKDGDSKIIAQGIDKASLYDALAMSMFLGDHDLNTGNFMIVATDPNQPAKIGRIDFGHAFNDLIKRWAIGNNAPDYKNQNHIIDCLNRSKVNGDQSKFQKTFRGVIPDEKFADALERMASPESLKKMQEGLSQAGQDLKNLVRDKDDQRTEQLRRSLITLCKRANHPIQNSSAEIDSLIDETMQNIEKFIQENARNALEAAATIRMQALVEEKLQKIRSNQFYPADIDDIISKCTEQNFALDDKREWAKIHDSPKPITGTLRDYITQRARELDVDPKLLIGSLKTASKRRAVAAQKEAVNIYQSALRQSHGHSSESQPLEDSVALSSSQRSGVQNNNSQSAEKSLWSCLLQWRQQRNSQSR